MNRSGNLALCFAILLAFAPASLARAQAGSTSAATPETSPGASSRPVDGATTTTTTTSVLQAGTARVSAVAPDYQIGAGDSLEVNVWKEPTISGTLPVRPDGMISLALVGDIQAAGQTPMELSNVITVRLSKFIINPSVTVSVLGVNSKHIYLIGEIGKPGEEPLTPGLTMLQAIASAGGLTPYANSRHVYILRGAAGKQQKINFDYKKAIKDGNLQGVALLAGDTIVVP